MIEALRQFLRPRPEAEPVEPPPPPAIPVGERVYAIGDIHGRYDLFVALANAIEEDDRQRGRADSTVVLLGDLVDRGPQSAEVIEAAIEWARYRKLRLIAGNHEEVFLRALSEPNAFRSFLRIGGRDTILSYPVDAAAFLAADFEEAREMARAAVPQAHVDFISEFEPYVSIGDYLFVHAGIVPHLPLDEQNPADLRWIREPFLTSCENHGCMVVHGHTIYEEAAVRPNRIGIDTGAFMTGRLTALVLEGTDRWLIETREEHDGIRTETRAVE